jgi:hypothetical protein
MRIRSGPWDAGLTHRDKRNFKPLAICFGLWTASFIAASLFLPRGFFAPAALPPWEWPLAILPLVFGTLVAYYFQRFLRGTDELMRRIHLEALAVGFAAAFVFGMGAGLLNRLGVPQVSGLTWAVMVIGYLVKLALSSTQYDG